MTAERSTPAEGQPAGVRGVRPGHSRRLIVVSLGLIACGLGILNAGREGFVTALLSYAATMSQLELADQAVQLSPSNSEAHYIRASLLRDTGETAEAIREYERAAALRPQDYVLWLELGRARDQANDQEGALAAFKESARLAPLYAKPHWQFGNTLFRAGRQQEAFSEFRRAVTSNPQLFPQAMNVAWSAFAGDAKALELAIPPETPSAHLALASFLARHGKTTEAIEQFRAAGRVSNERRQVLLADLLASKSFEAAFEVWSSGRQASETGSPQGLINGGFEEPIALDDPGFGWQLANNLQAVRASLDPSEPHLGSYSLRLDWSGDSDPSRAVISQLILVQPNARYRISFAARTRDMLSIGMPVVAVTDAGSEDGRVLQLSKAVPQGTSWWQDFTLEFVTPSSTRAVLIAIRRQGCSVAPCAALGYVWVDDFSVKRL